jgi:hypothetical protein
MKSKEFFNVDDNARVPMSDSQHVPVTKPRTGIIFSTIIIQLSHSLTCNRREKKLMFLCLRRISHYTKVIADGRRLG